MEKIADQNRTERRNTLGQTPLMQASADGEFETVKCLVEKNGANVMTRSCTTDSESLAIHLAADGGFTNIVAYFIDKYPELMEVRDKDGDTVLARAAYNGQVETVDILIRRGADLEAKGYRGRTPLMRAAARGHVVVMETLIAAGANIRAKSNRDDFEKTAIHFAAVFGHKDAVAMLVEKDSALAEVANLHGDTALCYAALGGHAPVIRYLLDNAPNQNVEMRGRYGRTPLMQAASMGHVEAVKFLIQRGAIVDAVSSSEDGKTTAAKLATKYGHESVVSAIIC